MTEIMASHRHPLLLLLMTAAFLIPASFAEEVACMDSLDECTQATGYSELMYSDDHVVCCAAGYSMRLEDNGDCFCNKTSDVVNCDTGPEKCGNGSSRTHHNQEKNVTECCQQGFFMQQIYGVVNGTSVSSCTCATTPVKAYTLTRSRNASAIYLHFVNYQGKPKALRELSDIYLHSVNYQGNPKDKALRELLLKSKSLSWRVLLALIKKVESFGQVFREAFKP